jgi:hypothetical protein
MGRNCLLNPIFAMTALICGAVQADWRTDAGFPLLQMELGASLPTGLGIPVMMSEASFGGNFYPEGTLGTLPYAGTGVLSGKTITPYSGPSGTSSHAAGVADIFCGSGSSVSPGVTDLQVWLADDFALNLFNTNPAPTYAGSVQNHSWVGSFGADSTDATLLRKLDFMINRDGTLVSTPMQNGATMEKLLANAYHGISAGLRSGNHPQTHSNLDVTGRMKPDLVVNQSVTSFAGPAVASVATLLLDAIRPGFPDADDPRVVKAIMLSAASKQNLLGWKRNSSSRPYDEVFGAGELNVLNAYHILAAGRQISSNSVMRPLQGWDKGTSSTSTPKRYFFTLPAARWGATMSATITWHRTIPNNYASSTLANLNLRLVNATGFTIGSTVTESISSIDNVEHLFLRNLPPGDYALEVSSGTNNVTYGIAWEVQTGTGPQLSLTRNGSQNTLSLSQLDPLQTYTVEVSTNMTSWAPATTIRTADTTPATSATWQETVSTSVKFYRLSWAP